MIRSMFLFGLAVLVLSGCTGEFPADASKLRSAEDAFDKQLLIQSLNHIEAWHAAHKTGVSNALGQGKNPSLIVAEFSETAGATFQYFRLKASGTQPTVEMV